MRREGRRGESHQATSVIDGVRAFHLCNEFGAEVRTVERVDASEFVDPSHGRRCYSMLALRINPNAAASSTPKKRAKMRICCNTDE
jgi:hypothetical protein